MLAVTVFGEAHGTVVDSDGTTRYCGQNFAYDRLHAHSHATVTCSLSCSSELVIRDGVIDASGEYTYYGIYYTSYAQKLGHGSTFTQGMTIVGVDGEMTMDDLNKVKRCVLYEDPSADRLYKVLNEKFSSILSIYST